MPDISECGCTFINSTLTTCNITNNDTVLCYLCAPGTASSNCTTACGLGTCSDFSKCLKCFPGNFTDTCGNNVCNVCQKGYISSERGSISCTMCPAGTHNSSDQSSCDSCYPGTWASEGASICTPCGPGYFNPSYNSTSLSACIVCTAGFYCPNTKNPRPLACPQNNYCPLGSSEPKPCPILHYSNLNAKSCSPSVIFYLLIAGAGVLVLVVVLVIVVRFSRSYFSPAKSAEKAKLIPEPLPTEPVYGGW